MNVLLDRITSNPEILNGKPVIRDMRFTVNQMLELLASGMSKEEILKDYPFIEAPDIDACLIFAANITNMKSVTPVLENA